MLLPQARNGTAADAAAVEGDGENKPKRTSEFDCYH
jgi:hypothetical protein